MVKWFGGFDPFNLEIYVYFTKNRLSDVSHSNFLISLFNRYSNYVFIQIGTGVTNGLIKARKMLDKDFNGESEDVPIISTSVAYGVYMGVSSNLRYMFFSFITLNGVTFLKYMIYNYIFQIYEKYTTFFFKFRCRKK